MGILFSLYAWTVWVLFALLVIPCLLLAIALLPRRVAYKYCRGVLRLGLTLTGIRVVGRNLEVMQAPGPFILMGNHVNLLDPFVFVQVIPTPAVALEKRQNFKIPLYGWLMNRWGNVPIDRENRDQALRDLEEAKRRITRDCWLMIMPEGTRTRDGKLGPFKKGGFHLAVETGIPILPFSMRGAFEILQTGRMRVRPGTVELIFHEPINPSAYGKERLDELIAEVRSRIAGEPAPRETSPELAGMRLGTS